MNARYDPFYKSIIVWDVGVNWFIKVHTSKLTLDYQQRPVYLPTGNDFSYAGIRGQVVLQQIFF